ncbi:MAG: hypothetical protein QOJ42_1484 [Acidobacteriaceae bacterium]|jgi:RNA polymerase sigma-70 factor (ECF subfamily)|nr:hypothetical protein [Acidobacteriaceae bacterium]
MQQLLLAQGQPKFTVRKPERNKLSGRHGVLASRVAMVEGSVGLIVAPQGRLFRVLRFTFANGLIASMEVIGDHERLGSIEVGVLHD